MNELKASIKLDASQAIKELSAFEKQTSKIINTMSGIEKHMAKLGAQSLVDKNLSKLYAQEDAILNKIRSEELEVEKTRQRSLDTLSNTDKVAKRVADEQYKQWWATELQNRDLLEQERIRQQSLNTLTATDKAVQRVSRAQYEAWWAAALTRQDWEKSHPILSRLDNRIKQMVSGNQRLNKLYNTTTGKLSSITNRVREWWTNQKMVHSATRNTNSMLDSTLSRLKSIAATYLGIMGTKAIINLSDTMTSSENKLNYTNATALGDKGYRDDGAYSAQTLQAIQNAMDKMYASAQKVRMSYSDMMTSVSKNMALADDAFQNNTDNAIRFQEIMAEAYAIGGAEAQEMRSSMYQLTQALGAGVLAGDELRSVREGAPLAYKAIEEFAQGVYDTEESLKELGSQGKITGEMVVAAIMNAGDEMDRAFAQTAQTFDQAWTQIVNTAQYAFKPVSEMLRTMLNDAIDNGLIQKVESFMVIISKSVQIIVTVIGNAINWVLENWNWLQDALIAGLLALTFVMTMSAIKGAIAFLWANRYIILLAVAIYYVMQALDMLQQGTLTTCQFIQYAFIALAVVILLITAKIMFGWLVATGVMTAGTAWMVLAIMAIVMVLLYFVFKFFEEVCGGAMWLLTALWNIASYITSFIAACALSLLAIIQNIIAFIVNLVVGCANAIVAISHNAVAGICNVAMGLVNTIQAVAQNIGIAFQNAWIWASNTFWEFIADVLSGVSKLEPVINGIAKLMGKGGIDLGGAVSAARSKKQEYRSFVSVGSAWNKGMNTIEYKNVGENWSKGWNTMNYADIGGAWSKGWNISERKDLSAAYEKGYNWGAGIKSNINEWGAGLVGSIGDKANGLTNLDEIGKKLGLDFSDFSGIANNNPNGYVPVSDLNRGTGGAGGAGKGSGFPSSKNPYYNAGNSYTPPSTDDLLKSVGNIGDDTASIADSMDLSAEDLEYLRKAAELDWKKEYTVAQITVDMTNNNNIGSDMDIETMYGKLTDKLYDELFSFSDGVFV